MAKQIMERRAADNEYLHKDFHGALSCGIDYLEQHYGESAVHEYLRRFTHTYFAPLRQALQERGLTALRDHFAATYEREGAEAEIACGPDELVIRLTECPAVSHMRAKSYPVARLFSETTRTVNEALCEDTAFAAELVEYDEATGARVERFYRRPAVDAAATGSAA